MNQKAKTKNKYPKQYLSGLSKKDKEKQKRSLNKAKKSYKKERGSKKYVDRPKLKSYKNKSSSWTDKFHKQYPEAKTLSEIAKVTGISKRALQAVLKKGKGAYYSSGSRPNQTAESWGKARMYSYILGGPTRKIDKHITDEYKVKFRHASVKGGYTMKGKKGKKGKKGPKSKKGPKLTIQRRTRKVREHMGALKKTYKKTSEWTKDSPECPKTPYHQPTIDREGENWIKLDLTKDVVQEDDRYILANEGITTGIYIMIVLKTDPDTLYVLKEYDDLSMMAYNEYDIPDDAEWPTYGHSSIYSNDEYQLEWLKETSAREYDKEAELEENATKKKKLFKKAEQARSQCLLYYAGIMYYDREIVLWTNHSGHFMPKAENMEKVGLPEELFVPMGSKEIDETIREHVLQSPPVSPASSPKSKMSKFLSLMSKK